MAVLRTVRLAYRPRPEIRPLIGQPRETCVWPGRLAICTTYDCSDVVDNSQLVRA